MIVFRTAFCAWLSSVVKKYRCKSKHFLIAFTLLGLVSPYAFALTPACNDVFPNVLQSFESNGKLNIGYNAQIFNSPDFKLSVSRITANSGSSLLSCDYISCVAKNSRTSAINVSFPKNDSKKTLKTGYQGIVSIDPAQGTRFSSISMDAESRLTILPSSTPYLIKKLDIGYASHLTLAVGDYYIEHLSINSSSKIQITGEGTTRLFVKGNIQFPWQSLVNMNGMSSPGASNKLFIYADGHVSLAAQAKVAAFIFTEKQLNLGQSDLYGSASFSNANLDAFARVFYQPTLSNADLTGICSTPVRDSDLDGIIDSLDECPNTPAGQSVDSRGCPIVSSSSSSVLSSSSVASSEVSSSVESASSSESSVYSSSSESSQASSDTVVLSSSSIQSSEVSSSSSAAESSEISSSVESSEPVSSSSSEQASSSVDSASSSSEGDNVSSSLASSEGISEESSSAQSQTESSQASSLSSDVSVSSSSVTNSSVASSASSQGVCTNGSTNYPRCDDQGLSVVITEPKSLLTIGHSPVTVKGTINKPDAILVVNGNPVEHSDGVFETQVTVEEGYNTIIASAVKGAGSQVTDSISVSLDLTPPYVTVESHTDNQKVSTDRITVTGLVNDIVRGTVEAEQAQVRVNGVIAEVSNRSYAARNIPLVEGANLIKITASDQVGNVESKTITVIYEIPEGKQVVLVSGQDQTAPINSVLPQPLSVKLVDAQGSPVANGTVVFRVQQDSGEVGVGTPNEGRAVVVQTNEQGVASTRFRLGLRTGVANNKVKAAAVGYESNVIFSASATTAIGNKLSVNSGNNQRGVVGQVLPAPLVTVVTDQGANVVRGARVRYETVKGGGVFENNESTIEVVTDSDGRATTRFVLGELQGLDAQQIRATLIDAPEGQLIFAGFAATGFVPADPGLTTVSGVVLDNQDNPIPGITMHIEGTTRKTQTNGQGRFVITSAPVGPIHLVADGSTASVAGEFPNLSYRLVTIAGVDNPLAAPIYMVKLNTKEAVYAGKEDVSITLEKFPGFKLEIPKNSVTFPDGAREGYISVTAVNASAVPMAPPNGMQPQFIVTIQPTGTRFDPPARLSLPNVDSHPPGAQVEMYSYDHDLEEFVSIGVGTVTEDGSVITSNPGVGVVKAGWHCGSQPGGSGTAHDCGDCAKCNGVSCEVDPAQKDKPLSKQELGDCKTATCSGSIPEPGDAPTIDTEKGNCYKPGCTGDKKDTPSQKAEIDDNDKAEETDETRGDCKKPSCKGGEPIDENDDEDISETDRQCKECNAGDLVNRPDERSVDNSSCCIGGESTPIKQASFSDLTNNCPNRTQDETLIHPIDGCSGPGIQSLENALIETYFLEDFEFYVTLPTWGAPQSNIGWNNHGQVNLACNKHDICYQSCGSDRNTCDDALVADGRAECERGYPPTCPAALDESGDCPEYFVERTLCLEAVNKMYDEVLRDHGQGAYEERQSQHCDCCGE